MNNEIPKGKYISKYKGRAKGFYEAQKLLTLSLERQFRCGNGNGKTIIGHSFNCECPRLNREIAEIEKRIKEMNLTDKKEGDK